MSWFKVDDRLWGHPKWLATPLRARGLWVTAGSWCSSQGQDGEVPRHVLTTLGGTTRDAAALVSSGLWFATDTGWAFHDWDEFQPDAASQRAKRNAESAGGAEGNHIRWHVNRRINVPDCEFCNASGPDRVPESGANPPVPTRPDPIPEPDVASPSVVGNGDQASIVKFRTRRPADRLTIERNR